MSECKCPCGGNIVSYSFLEEAFDRPLGCSKPLEECCLKSLPSEQRLRVLSALLSAPDRTSPEGSSQ